MKALLVSFAVLLLAACTGESRETRLYGDRAHEIAGDTAPWANEPFRGDQQGWDHEMEKRARLQNEYSRIR